MAGLSSVGFVCSGIQGGSLSRGENLNQATPPKTTHIIANGTTICLRNCGAVVPTRIARRKKTTAEAIKITNAVRLGETGDTLLRRARLTVVAVLEISPPSTPVAHAPARSPVTL